MRVRGKQEQEQGEVVIAREEVGRNWGCCCCSSSIPNSSKEKEKRGKGKGKGNHTGLIGKGQTLRRSPPSKYLLSLLFALPSIPFYSSAPPTSIIFFKNFFFNIYPQCLNVLSNERNLTNSSLIYIFMFFLSYVLNA